MARKGAKSEPKVRLRRIAAVQLKYVNRAGRLTHLASAIFSSPAALKEEKLAPESSKPARVCGVFGLGRVEPLWTMFVFIPSRILCCLGRQSSLRIISII